MSFRSRPFGKLNGTSGIDLLIYFSIVGCLMLQLNLQMVQKINWDEFYFLSLIHEYQRGDLARPLQTLHVHLFGWLTKYGDDEIDRIVLARGVMWIFQIGTVVLIFLTSRLFCSHRASLLGVLSYVCAGYVLIHGVSFRADPMAAFFSMLCVYLLAGSRLSYKSLLLMGVALAVAIHITVKVVLFLPLFVWLGTWQLSQFGRPVEAIIRLVLSAIVCVVLGFSIYFFQLQSMPDHASRYSVSVVSSAPSTVFLESGIFPRWNFIKESVLLSLPQTILLFVGVVASAYHTVKIPNIRANALVLFGMLLPLLSMIFYRNAFPYFFPFIFPPSVCLISYGASLIQRKNLAVVLLVIFLTGNQFINYSARVDEDLAPQKEVISFLHHAFPDGISYIDRCSMFGAGKKYGYFMSSWGHAIYRKNARPIIRDQALRENVPVVVANSSMLKFALESGATSSSGSLLYTDAEFLNKNYVQHWGHVWVAGKDVSVDESGSDFIVQISGDYTVEADSPVTINGEVYTPGSPIELEKDLNYSIVGSVDIVRFRWGDNLYRPSHQPIGKRLFNRF